MPTEDHPLLESLLTRFTEQPAVRRLARGLAGELLLVGRVAG